MGYDVFTSIMCPVMTSVWDKDLKENIPTPFVEIAKKHLTVLSKQCEAVLSGATDQDCPEGVCLAFLQDVAEDRCIFSASKGDGLCWAAEGNGTNIESVADQLLPFFMDLWNINAIFWSHGIVITTNGESEGKTQVIQLRLTQDAQCKSRFKRGPIGLADVKLTSFTEEWHVKFDR